MIVLSVNSKVSSLKFFLISMKNNYIMASGRVDGIGSESGKCWIKYNGQKVSEEIKIENHEFAANIILDKLISLNIINSIQDIACIGHRIIHGGGKYYQTVVIDDDILNDIKSYTIYVPLHGDANVAGVEAFRKICPDTTMVAVFDNAYYQNLEEKNFLYSVPYSWYKNYNVRKFGAHGISHKYVANSIKDVIGKEDFKLISCHIGNGVSISAIENMKCIDTSMGFSPLAGAMMGTRSGDIDSSIIPYIMEKEGKNAAEVIDDLNRKSGLLGVSEYSSDMRDILAKCEENDFKSSLAKDIYIDRIVSFIAKYYVQLGGCDVLAFTAGIGENSSIIRREICEKLSCLGIIIDPTKNDVNGEIQKISSNESNVDIYVVPKNEEFMISQEAYEVIKNR